MDHLSVCETARVLGVPTGTVKAQTARARAKVLKSMRGTLHQGPAKRKSCSPGRPTKQSSRARNQTGGRVCLFRHTDDFWRDHNALTPQGKKSVRAPRRRAIRNSSSIRKPLRQEVGSAATLLHLARIDHYDRVPPSESIQSKQWRDGSPFHQISVGDQLYPLPCQNLPSSGRGQYIQFDFP